MRNNRLNFKKMTALSVLLKEKREFLHKHNCTFAQAAALASEELGFSVTANNVEAVCNDLDLRWKPKRRKSTPARSVHSELEKMRRQIAFLYEELGLPVPEELAEAN